ncbi:MAG: phenylalanine--tRNA ligase subunit beta [Proteobacteria bacterium]|nr:phenylalanine--tRNA ligase subunit beta [Pseudomonadota bacterium]
MKITHSWLKEFVPSLAPPAQLAAQLTLAGLEVESLAPAAPPFEGVVVGSVLEAVKHPNAEKLSLCTVTTDGTNRLQIVCGAPNARAGIKVAVAMVGAKLPGEVTIRRAKLRGIESQGMLCSARELGLGTEHDGILALAADAPLGQDLRAALDLDDTLLEINTTPNRGDCMSVLGIARDHQAAAVRQLLRHTVEAVPAAHAEEFPVRIDAPEGCPVFASRIIRGVRAGAESPAWLKERLRRVGVNSISAAVDVTNYVMMELGQPMHAYDLGRLSQGITVRWARAGEPARLLDGKDYTLTADCLVIADDAGVIGLAGVMGGQDKAISDTTTDVLLEAAHFTPSAISGRARRFGLFTDASQRFERGVDPRLPAQAIERATALLLRIAGGQAGPVSLTHGTEVTAPIHVSLRRERLARLLGAEVPDAEVAALLGAVSENVTFTGTGWSAQVPSFRFDLRIEPDLIEEVARLRGFDEIAPRHAIVEQKGGEASEARIPLTRLLTAMADRGYREVITYSFVNPEDQRLLFPDLAGLALTNPISSELSEMRVSLWPGLLRACAQNLRRQQPRVRIFELGRKYLQTEQAMREVETLAGVVAGSRRPEQWAVAKESTDFYDVKADLAALFELTGEPQGSCFVAEKLSCLRPGRTARIYRDGEAVGWLGEVHPGILRKLDLGTSAYVFELEIDFAFRCKKLTFKEFSKFPGIRRDIALIVDEKVTYADIEENVSVSASGLLRELRIFDVYRGQGIETGRKSVALGLILQDSSRTLTDDDADAVVTAVVGRLRQKLNATIRDQ